VCANVLQRACGASGCLGSRRLHVRIACMQRVARDSVPHAASAILRCCGEWDSIRHAGAWAAEILEVLAPLVIDSREAAEQLVTLGGMHALSHLVHHPTGEPLPLSLMLDMVEALVAMGDASVQVRQRPCRMHACMHAGPCVAPAGVCGTRCTTHMHAGGGAADAGEGWPAAADSAGSAYRRAQPQECRHPLLPGQGAPHNRTLCLSLVALVCSPVFRVPNTVPSVCEQTHLRCNVPLECSAALAMSLRACMLGAPSPLRACMLGAPSPLRACMQEAATVEVMQAVISPRTLHDLCRVALESVEAGDLAAGATVELLALLLTPGSLPSLRNLILGRCVHTALSLSHVAPQVVAMATTVSGQACPPPPPRVSAPADALRACMAAALGSLAAERVFTPSLRACMQAVLDNLAAENALDCALAAAHLFTACSDASLLTKQHRLAVLCAAALCEARDGAGRDSALATAAIGVVVRHLRALHACMPDAAGSGMAGVPTRLLSGMVRLWTPLASAASRARAHAAHACRARTGALRR
jgi:hypothetical protein